MNHIKRNRYFPLQIFLLVLFFSVQSSVVSGQENYPVTFGKVKANDFVINSSLVNENTDAVIIADGGNVKFEGNAKGWFTYIYKKEKRIKIINKRAFELATVEIPLYQNDDSKEKIENLTAITYNIDNGKVVSLKLDSKDLFEEKIDKNHLYKKFSLPGVKEGSVIEYSYTIKSEFEFNLPSWEFQNRKYPTLWSEYNVTIPNLLTYTSVIQGYHKFYINNGKEGRGYYTVKKPVGEESLTPGESKLSVSTYTVIHRWVMKDVSCLKNESFVSSPENLIDKISFQLSKTYDGEEFHDVANNWKTVSQKLLERDDFGRLLNADNQWFDKILSQIITDAGDKLQEAKKIYYYIQNNFTCTNYNGIFIKTSLQNVFKNKKGTVGEINLLLASMLNRRNITSSPVLLSTREFGRNSPGYPLLDRINYVICKARINSVDYFLDAAKPFLAFGKLPLECYNGHARIISEDAGPVYFLTDSIREFKSKNVMIFNSDKKVAEGNYNCIMGFFESLDTKNEIAKSGIDVFKKNIAEPFPDKMLISNVQVDSFEMPDAPISVKFDFTLKPFDISDIVYFNPVLGSSLIKNPFSATERVYPVEMPYTTDDIYSFFMEIPEGYIVDELPKSVKINLNENEGYFEYLINADGAKIQLRRRLILKKATFANQDYQALRDFYANIVKKEAEQIVFKRRK